MLVNEYTLFIAVKYRFPSVSMAGVPINMLLTVYVLTIDPVVSFSPNTRFPAHTHTSPDDVITAEDDTSKPSDAVHFIAVFAAIGPAVMPTPLCLASCMYCGQSAPLNATDDIAVRRTNIMS